MATANSAAKVKGGKPAKAKVKGKAAPKKAKPAAKAKAAKPAPAPVTFEAPAAPAPVTFNRNQAESMRSFFSALACEHRIVMLAALRDNGEMTTREWWDTIETSPTCAAIHARILRAAGLTSMRREKKTKHNYLTEKGRLALAAAESLFGVGAA